MSDPEHPMNREAVGIREAIEAALVAELKEKALELSELRAATFDVQIVPVGEHLGAELPAILFRVDWPAGGYLERPRRVTYQLDGFGLPVLFDCDLSSVTVKQLAGVALFGTYPPLESDPRGLVNHLRASAEGRRRINLLLCNAAAVYLFGADCADGASNCRVEDNPPPIER